MTTALEVDHLGTESGQDVAEASCPESGRDASVHPKGGYHVLKRVPGGYLAVYSKRVGRWDTAKDTAWWAKADAAKKWAAREFPDTPTMIEECDLELGPCLLRPKRKGPRPIKISLAELQQLTGLDLGKAKLLRRIAEGFKALEALEAVDVEEEE